MIRHRIAEWLRRLADWLYPQVTLSPEKIANLVVLTQELLADSTPLHKLVAKPARKKPTHKQIREG